MWRITTKSWRSSWVMMNDHCIAERACNAMLTYNTVATLLQSLYWCYLNHTELRLAAMRGLAGLEAVIHRAVILGFFAAILEFFAVTPYGRPERHYTMSWKATRCLITHISHGKTRLKSWYCHITWSPYFQGSGEIPMKLSSNFPDNLPIARRYPHFLPPTQHVRISGGFHPRSG